MVLKDLKPTNNRTFAQSLKINNQEKENKNFSWIKYAHFACTEAGIFQLIV